MTQKYLKLEIEIQVSSTYFQVVRIEKQIRPFIFLEKLQGSTILFRDLLTFSWYQKDHKKYVFKWKSELVNLSTKAVTK